MHRRLRRERRAINELIVGVNLAFGSAPQTSVSASTPTAVGRPRWESVAVNELIAAVNNALTGYPPDASGMLLQAPADMSALDAVASSTISAARQAPSSAAQENVLIRNRIELGFTPGATVGQANELLNSVGGRIFMMLCERADPVGPGA